MLASRWLWALALGCAASLPGASGRRTLLQARAAAGPPAAVAAAEATCDDLWDTQVFEHKLGAAAEIVCRSWPAAMGPFPGVDAWQLPSGFGPGSVFDMALQMLRSNARKNEFCWKRNALRSVLRPSCPHFINDTWSCEESVQPDAQAEAQPMKCKCSSKSGGSIVLPPQQPPTCQLERGGICYGSCPRGYQPTSLVGATFPVCSSICADNGHPHNCALGCANTAEQCTELVDDKVVDLASAAAIGASLALAARSELSWGVAIVHFSKTRLKELTRAASRTWRSQSLSEVKALLLIVLFQAYVERMEELGVHLDHFRAQIEQVVAPLLELVDNSYKFNDFSFAFFHGLILRHTEQVAENTARLVSHFLRTDCNLAAPDVAFTVERVGDERLLGPWIAYGQWRDRPRYTRVGNADAIVEWSESRQAWRMYVNNLKGWSRSTLYLSRQGADSELPPVGGWEVEEGLAPGPVLVRVGTATRDVAFTIERVGDERLLGPWKVVGQRRGRPRYNRVGDPDAIVEWSERRQGWRMYVNNWNGWGRSTLYLSKQGANSELPPVDGWEIESGLAPGPVIVHSTAATFS